MHSPRVSRWIVGLAFLIAIPASAQEKSVAPKSEPMFDGLLARTIHLLPPAIAAELNLKPEQKAQIQRIEEEYRNKRREAILDAAGKVMTIIDGIQEGGDFESAPTLAICHEITGGLLQSRRARIAYEKKMLAVLDDRQKDEFARLKNMGPLRPRRANPIEEAEPRFSVAKRAEALNLTDEQKTKLAEMQREMENRFREMLTPEQRQQFDNSRREPIAWPKSKEGNPR